MEWYRKNNPNFNFSIGSDIFVADRTIYLI